MKKKILFIHHAAGWGGASINLINIINSLDKTHYIVEVLLLKDSIFAQKLRDQNISYTIASSIFYRRYYKYFSHTVPGFSQWYRIPNIFFLSFSWLLSRYFFAANILKNYEVDIIQLNSSVLTDWLAPCKKLAKVVMHIQEPFSNGYFGIRAKFFRCQMKKYADKLIIISLDNSKRIDIPEKTTVIYNYAEVPKNLPSEDSFKSKRVLYLGGASYIKGFYTLVESLDELDEGIRVLFGGSYSTNKKNKNTFKDVLKYIFSIGKKKKKALEKVKKHPNAVVLGMTNQVSQLMNEVCCLISPFSVSHFSRPVIEAYLHHKPAIGSDVQGMDEIIENGITGLIVEKDNPKILAAAINYLCNNPEKVREMGVNGYNIAITKFTPKNIMKFEEVYNQVLGKC